MTKLTFLTAAAASALIAGAALAQQPAQQTKPPATTTAPEPAAPAPAPAVAAPAPAQVAPRGDIVATLKASGQFTILLKALDATNLTGVLQKNQNLTLFAPTDAAFNALPPGELDRLLKNPTELQKVLTYHLVNANVDSTKLKGAKGPVPTVAGSAINIDGSGATVLAGNATVTQVDVKATNGTIHVVDKVLVPGSAPPAVAAAPAAADTTSDAATTEPAAPPPEVKPAEPAAPPAEPEPEAKPQAMLISSNACQAEPSGPITEPQKRSVQDQKDEQRTDEQELERENAVPAEAPAASTTATDASMTAPVVTTTTVTNGPVPDTPETRAKYPPQSRAGKATAARGNK